MDKSWSACILYGFHRSRQAGQNKEIEQKNDMALLNLDAAIRVKPDLAESLKYSID